jgi:hypothetical protein
MAALEAELGAGASVDAIPMAVESGREGVFGDMLAPEEERLVVALEQALARIAAAVAGSHPDGPVLPASLIASALGGAGMLMRAELAARRPERLDELLPAIAYLVTLPYLGQQEALALSRRTRELLDDERRGMAADG